MDLCLDYEDEHDAGLAQASWKKASADFLWLNIFETTLLGYGVGLY